MKNMSTRDAIEYTINKQEEKNSKNREQGIPVQPSKPRYAELNFDGQKLDWVENDQIKKSWPAMSGREGYQAKEFTNMKNYGPLPEGSWNVPQENLQHFDDLSLFDKAKSYLGTATKILGYPKGKWPGVGIAWGKHRIELEPDEQTDTQGRTNAFIHGGQTLGSAGCVDLAQNMDEFTDEYEKYGRDMKLNIRYPKSRW